MCKNFWATIRVRNHNGQCAYGAPIPVDDQHWEIAEELADLESDEAQGIITVGGQAYEWTRVDDTEEAAGA